MACACNKRKPAPVYRTQPPAPVQTVWTLTTETGEVHKFGSKLEALAARIRLGGGVVK